MDRWALRSHVRVLAGVAVPLFLATSTQASAQSLRYVTSESGGVYIESPMGAMEVEAEGYSELTLVFDGTSVSAKYDTLYSYVGGTQGDQSPDVAPIVAGSFELVLERPGVLKTVSHPIVAAEGVGGIDPLHMFDDFLIPLPEEPLSVGRQWSEEMMHDGSSFPDATYYQTRSMTMRVERDTVVNGTPAFVVSVAQDVVNEASGVMPGMGFDYVSTSQGTDNGIAILSVDGTMLHRERQIDMSGIFTISVQGQTFDMPQTMSFTSTAELVQDS